MHARALMLALLLAVPIPAGARQYVRNLKPLLIQALVTGRAEGVLENESVKKLSGRFGTTAPILVDVVEIGSNKQPGCGRLRITTRQAGVRERNAKGAMSPPEDKSLVWDVDFCRDGTFPQGEGGGQ